MINTSKLKGVKTTVLTALLTAGAIFTPLKSSSAEVSPTNTTLSSVTPTNTTLRKQMLEKAVRSGAPREEIVKYMDFPGFIPVTKDGQFDKEKADKWSKDLTSYARALAKESEKKHEKVSASDAYRIFAETTHQKNVSLDDFERACNVIKDAENSIFSSVVGGLYASIFVLLAAGWTCYLGAAALQNTGAFITGLTRKKFDSDAFFGLLTAGGLATLVGKFAMVLGTFSLSMIGKTQEQSIYEIYERSYDSHVQKTIHSQQEKPKTTTWTQAQQIKAVEQK